MGSKLFYNYHCTFQFKNTLTRKVFGFEQTYMYEILVTGPLCTSECAGECGVSANMCKRTLDINADVIAEVIVDATRNVDILTINASDGCQ